VLHFVSLNVSDTSDACSDVGSRDDCGNILCVREWDMEYAEFGSAGFLL
jgi:hypothetical protein